MRACGRLSLSLSDSRWSPPPLVFPLLPSRVVCCPCSSLSLLRSRCFALPAPCSLALVCSPRAVSGPLVASLPETLCGNNAAARAWLLALWALAQQECHNSKHTARPSVCCAYCLPAFCPVLSRPAASKRACSQSRYSSKEPCNGLVQQKSDGGSRHALVTARISRPVRGVSQQRG